MAVRRPRVVLPSGRVSLTLIGRKLLWERKFGKFHTSRSRAVSDINKTGKNYDAGSCTDRLTVDLDLVTHWLSTGNTVSLKVLADTLNTVANFVGGKHFEPINLDFLFEEHRER